MPDEASFDGEYLVIRRKLDRERQRKIMGDVWRAILQLKEETTISLQRVLQVLPDLGEHIVRACINEFVKAKALVQQGEDLLFATPPAS